VTPADVEEVAHGALAGLLGRGPRDPDPGRLVADLSADAESTLLESAEQRLGLPAERVRRERRYGRREREVVRAAEGADLLVLARDGDRSRLGPKSLGPATRFVVDHAPCPVLLVWPEPAPRVESIPPPPPHHGPPPP
jgi:nucleotide-binding universal stress UspA family protein